MTIEQKILGSLVGISMFAATSVAMAQGYSPSYPPPADVPVYSTAPTYAPPSYAPPPPPIYPQAQRNVVPGGQPDFDQVDDERAAFGRAFRARTASGFRRSALCAAWRPAGLFKSAACTQWLHLSAAGPAGCPRLRMGNLSIQTSPARRVLWTPHPLARRAILQQHLCILAARCAAGNGAEIRLAPRLKRQEVSFVTKEPAGTIIVDTPNTYLYYVLGHGRAIRYGVRVGREPGLHGMELKRSRARPSGPIGLPRRK